MTKRCLLSIVKYTLLGILRIKFLQNIFLKHFKQAESEIFKNQNIKRRSKKRICRQSITKKHKNIKLFSKLLILRNLQNSFLKFFFKIFCSNNYEGLCDENKKNKKKFVEKKCSESQITGKSIFVVIFVFTTVQSFFKASLCSEILSDSNGLKSSNQYEFEQNKGGGIIFGDMTRTMQPKTDDVSLDDVEDYKQNKFAKTITNDREDEEGLQQNKKEDKIVGKKNNTIEPITAIDIEADDIKIYGKSLVHDKNNEDNKKDTNKKNSKDAVVVAKNDVVATTNNGSTIYANEVIVSAQNKTAEFKGNIDANLFSPDRENQGMVNLKGDDMVIFNSLDNLFITKALITTNSQTGKSYINGDFIEKDKKRFIISNSTISGCEMQHCKKQILPWSFGASKTVFDSQKNTAEMQNFVFKFYNIPMLYLPYLKVNMNKSRKYIEEQKLIMLRNQTGISFSVYPVLKEKTFGYKITPSFEIYNPFSFFSILPIKREATVNDKLMYRQNNIGLKIKKYDENGAFILRGRFARDQIPDIKQQITDDSKKNRYSLQFAGDKQIDDNSYFDYKFSRVSDIFFVSKYDMRFDPYYTTALSYQRKTKNNLSFFNINGQQFQNISLALSGKVQEPQILPQILFSKTFTKYDNSSASKFLNNSDTISINSDSINIVNKEGMISSRITNALSYNKKLNLFGYNLVNAGFKGVGSLYSYQSLQNYQSVSVLDSSSSFSGQSQNYLGYIDFLLNGSLPLFKKGKFVNIGIEPKFMAAYNPFDANKNAILNQDSNMGFLNPSNMFSQNIINGHDRVEEGFRTSYGATFSAILNNDSLSQDGFFATMSQRYSQYSKSTIAFLPFLQNGFSGYAFDFLAKYDIFYAKSQNITQSSSNMQSKFLSNSAGVNFKYFNLSGGQELISSDYYTLDPINGNIRSVFYSIDFKPFKNYFLQQYVARQSIVNSPGKYSIITRMSLNYNSPCLIYSIGLQTISQTQVQSQQNQQFIFSFQLLL